MACQEDELAVVEADSIPYSLGPSKALNEPFVKCAVVAHFNSPPQYVEHENKVKKLPEKVDAERKQKVTAESFVRE